MKKPNDKIVKILIEEEIEENLNRNEKLKKQLKCSHVWKIIDSYYDEDSYWVCTTCGHRPRRNIL